MELLPHAEQTMNIKRASLSLDDFVADASSHLTRLRESGQAQVLTVNDEPLAVMLSPGHYAELQHAAEEVRETEKMRKAIREIEEGKSRDGFEALEEIKKRVLAETGQ